MMTDGVVLKTLATSVYLGAYNMEGFLLETNGAVSEISKTMRCALK